MQSNSSFSTMNGSSFLNHIFVYFHYSSKRLDHEIHLHALIFSSIISSMFMSFHSPSSGWVVGFVWKLGRCPKSCFFLITIFILKLLFYGYPHFQAHAHIISSWLHIPVNIHIAGLYPHFSNFRISHLHKLHHVYIYIYIHTYVYTYIYIYMYINVYIYIYPHWSWLISPIQISGYSFITGNDEAIRDPILWQLWGSPNDVDWVTGLHEFHQNGCGSTSNTWYINGIKMV